MEKNNTSRNNLEKTHETLNCHTNFRLSEDIWGRVYEENANIEIVLENMLYGKLFCGGRILARTMNGEANQVIEMSLPILGSETAVLAI